MEVIALLRVADDFGVDGLDRLAEASGINWHRWLSFWGCWPMSFLLIRADARRWVAPAASFLSAAIEGETSGGSQQESWVNLGITKGIQKNGSGELRPAPSYGWLDLGGAPAARGQEQTPADDERQPAHRGHEDPRMLFAQEAA